MLSSRVMTPFWLTFSIASEIRLPMTSSPEEMVPTRAMSLEPDTGWEMALMPSTAAWVAFWMPLRMTMGLAPAARFFRPSLIIA